MTVSRLKWILEAAVKDGHGNDEVIFEVSECTEDDGLQETYYNIQDWRLSCDPEGKETFFLTWEEEEPSDTTQE